MLYFHSCSFMRGHRSTTPKWCVGVCSGPTRIWVIGLAHPHQHDTAQKNRLQSCQQRKAVQIPQPVLHTLVSIFYTCVGEWTCMWGGKGKQKFLDHLSHVQSCLHCSTWVLFAGVCVFFFMFCVFTPPKAVCKMKGLVMPQGREWWFSDYIALYLEETPKS